jgi:hypothetical protein
MMSLGPGRAIAATPAYQAASTRRKSSPPSPIHQRRNRPTAHSFSRGNDENAAPRRSLLVPHSVIVAERSVAAQTGRSARFSRATAASPSCALFSALVPSDESRESSKPTRVSCPRRMASWTRGQVQSFTPCVNRGQVDPASSSRSFTCWASAVGSPIRKYGSPGSSSMLTR